MSDPLYKTITQFLVELGIDDMPHTQKTYLGHLVGVHRLMEQQGCGQEACRAGLLHSVYGTERFQRFQLPLERRGELQAMVGARAEKLAYLNCAMDRASLDAVVTQRAAPYPIRDRITGNDVLLDEADMDDLCRVHLYDWLEQVSRSSLGWGYRRTAYRQMAERLGPTAVAEYDRVFAGEPRAEG